MSAQKDVEMTELKSNVPDEEDVIIGRFRKISSAKSMAATNGNIQYPTEVTKSEDVEAGIQFRARDEKDRPLSPKLASVDSARSQLTKSSFRDVEKPSRFKDHPSATRFQVPMPIIT